MAYDCQVLICNQFGVAKAEIHPAIEFVSWRLNNVGRAKMSLPWTDAKCTKDNLQYGNRLVIQWDNGLPDWGGVIDTPRSRSTGVTTFTAYSAECLLDWRVTAKGRYFSAQNPGYIAKTLLSDENAEYTTGITEGTIAEDGTDRTLEYHYHDLLRRFKDLARLSGEDFYVVPTYSSGVLTFALNWYNPRGTDYSDSVWLNAANVDEDRTKLDEQGPIHNRVIVVGEGQTWGDERLDSISVDATSREKNGYREYSETQSASVQTTLDANADAILAEVKDPRNALSIFVTNTAPAIYSAYDVADTVTVDLWNHNAEWWYNAEVRVIAREWYSDDTCRLEVQET